jgi:hypothetical protein
LILHCLGLLLAWLQHCLDDCEWAALPAYRIAPKYYRKRKRKKIFSAIDLKNEKNLRFLFPVIFKKYNKNA